MKRCIGILAVVAVLALAGRAQGAVDVWQSLGSTVVGSGDLQGDGTYLYKIGGTNVDRYDGITANTWTNLTTGNPVGYGHASPGESSRSYSDGGAIMTINNGSGSVSRYDISGGGWTSNAFPVADGAYYGWDQGSMLNPVTGQILVRWTELDAPGGGITDPYCQAWFDTAAGTWGARTVVSGPVPNGTGTTAAYGSNAVYSVQSDLTNQIVTLNIYDLTTQAADFSGSWASKTYDLGAGNVFFGLDHARQTDACAVNPDNGRVYLVSSLSYNDPVNGWTGFALEYDPATDTWRQLEDHDGTGLFHNFKLAVAPGSGNYLFADAPQDDTFQAMELIPEPATLGLLCLGGLGLLLKRKRKP